MKINIVVSKTLNSGQKANVSAIIMGQLGHDIPTLYTDTIVDTSGTKHAGITTNVVILDGSEGQLSTLVECTRKINIICIVFSATGQLLNNNYTEYQQKISSSDTKNTKIVGVGIYGNDEVVKKLTKKFSLSK